MTPDELPDDMEAVVARLEVSAIDPVPWPDLRDLLKAYQKQRRALERIAITTLRDDGGAKRRLGQVVTEARATLNQKGDER
jgi:hypothetical protein